jgi:Ca2+-binding EF-hand superfamily protein
MYWSSAMMLALGAVSSALDMLHSLSATKSGSASSTGQTQGAAATNPFDPDASTQGQISTGLSAGTSGGSISPQTMSALIQAQSQSGSTSSAPTDRSGALQDLFSQIDANGDGSITKSEFEGALGAGGTNVAAADKVFGELDKNGDGSVGLDELKSALKGAGHHGGHHHMHAGGSGGSNDSASSDPLTQALDGASSTSVTNSDGSTTTSITYADGSKVTMTTPAASTSSSGSSSNSAASSYNSLDQMMQRQGQMMSLAA